MKYMISCFFIVLLCMGCSEQQPKLPEEFKHLDNIEIYPSETEPIYDVQIKRQSEYGETEKTFLSKFTDIAIDEEGKVYFADSGQSNIKVYKADGEYLKTLGREGKGPGEFINIQNIQINNSKLYAYDNSLKRIEVFNVASSSHINTIQIATNKDKIPELKGAYFSGFHIRNDGTLLTAYYKYSYPDGKEKWGEAVQTNQYYIMDNKGRIVSDKLFETKSAVRVFIPSGPVTVDRETGFHGQGFISLTDDNTIYSTWSDYFLIKSYNPQGKYRQAFYYPLKRVPLTKQSAVEAGIPELVTEGMSNMEVPEYWPALDNLLIDEENRLWVSTIISDLNKREWFILDKHGKLLSKFRWPARNDIQIVKNNSIYTLETNKETELQKIVRHEFNISRNNN